MLLLLERTADTDDVVTSMLLLVGNELRNGMKWNGTDRNRMEWNDVVSFSEIGTERCRYCVVVSKSNYGQTMLLLSSAEENCESERCCCFYGNELRIGSERNGTDVVGSELALLFILSEIGMV